MLRLAYHSFYSFFSLLCSFAFLFKAHNIHFPFWLKGPQGPKAIDLNMSRKFKTAGRFYYYPDTIRQEIKAVPYYDEDKDETVATWQKQKPKLILNTWQREPAHKMQKKIKRSATDDTNAGSYDADLTETGPQPPDHLSRGGHASFTQQMRALEDETTWAECKTTKTAVWRRSRFEDEILLCNPCYIKKHGPPSARALTYHQPPTPDSYTESEPGDLPTLEENWDSLTMGWYLQHCNSESQATSLFVSARYLIKEPDTIFVMQVARSNKAYVNALNIVMLTKHTFRQLPMYNW
mgnify:CR=1 FL=1